MAKFILLILVYIIILPVISVFTMIYGWGVNPASWGIIIGGYVLSFALGLIVNLVPD